MYVIGPLPSFMVSIALCCPLHYLHRTLYGEDAREEPERMNEVTGVYAKKCIELAEEMGLHSINLWSKLQETEGWQKKFLRFAIFEASTCIVY